MVVQRWATAVLLTALLMASRSADARGQWAVTIAPTMDPLPLGFCGAVRLQLLDETGKDRPRNPAGQLIGMADFDMSVTSSDTRAVVGQYIDASHWSVCACHAGVAGAIATITASYPARHLAPASRVPGVAFQKQATLTLTRGAGQANPRGCDAPQPAAIVAAGVTAGGTSVTASAAPLTVVGADVASGVVAVAPGRVSGAVPASGNDATSVGGGASIGQGLITGPPSSIAPTSKSKPTPAPTPPVPVGPEPKDVQILGTPAEAVISWYAPYTYGSPAPTGYTVERWKQSDPACCRATSPVLTAREWRDPVMWSGVWMYKVMAMYADGRRGSAQRSYTYAGPTIPTGFKAVQVGRDSVVLTWNKVSGASYYLVGGPPTNVMFRADSPRAVITGVPVGSHTWKLASMYEAKTGDASPPKQSSAFEHASVAVVQRQYRIIAEALRVTQATVDDPWSGDGRWDEVFVTSLAELFDHKTGNLLTRLPPVVSVVHGDVAKYPSPEGVRAGSASADGGIRHGDVVTPIVGPPAASAGGGPPLVLWEGELVDGTHDLLLHPVIWDVDTPRSYLQRSLGGYCASALCTWHKYLTGPSNSTYRRPEVAAAITGSQIAVKEGNDIWMGSNGYMVHMENIDKDRPIGMEVGANAPRGMGLVARMRDRVVVLSREKIETALRSGNARIEVRFWDHWVLPGQPATTVNYLGGDYTLVLRVDRVQ